jgi:hypothetical protein
MACRDLAIIEDFMQVSDDCGPAGRKPEPTTKGADI